MKSGHGNTLSLNFLMMKSKFLVNLEKLSQEKESVLITNTNIIKRRFNENENWDVKKRIRKEKKPSCHECSKTVVE